MINDALQTDSPRLFEQAVGTSSIERWLQVERKHAKGQLPSWGRAVIRSIDLDDCLQLYRVFIESTSGRNSNKTPFKQKSLASQQQQQQQQGDTADSVNIDQQTDHYGYAHYLWTPAIHKFIGDTALHYALKQRKLMCVNMLLILDANYEIANAAGMTAAAICSQLYEVTIKNVKFEAMKNILRGLKPTDFKQMSNGFTRYRGVEEEAMRLVQQGRVLYSEPPQSFSDDCSVLQEHFGSLRRAHLSFNSLPVHSAAAAIDGRSNHTGVDDVDDVDAAVAATAAAVIGFERARDWPDADDLVKETAAAATTTATTTAATIAAAAATVSESSWISLQDDAGNTYYYNEQTGESSWERPAEEQPTAAGAAASTSRNNNSSSSSSKSNNNNISNSNNNNNSNSKSNNKSKSSKSNFGSVKETSTKVDTAVAATASNAKTDSKASVKASAVSSRKSTSSEKSGAVVKATAVLQHKSSKGEMNAVLKVTTTTESEDSDDNSGDNSGSDVNSGSDDSGGSSEGNSNASDSKNHHDQQQQQQQKQQQNVSHKKQQQKQFIAGVSPLRRKQQSLADMFAEADKPMGLRAQVESLKEEIKSIADKLHHHEQRYVLQPVAVVDTFTAAADGNAIDAAATVEAANAAAISNSDPSLSEQQQQHHHHQQQQQQQQPQQQQQQPELSMEEVHQLRKELLQLQQSLTAKNQQLSAQQQQRAIEARFGVSLTPGSWAVGDVWGRDRLSDLLLLIQRQQRLFQQRTATAGSQFTARGLSLLNSVQFDGSLQRAVAEEEDLRSGKRDAIYVPEGINELQGVKKLKFLRMGQLNALATSFKATNKNASPSMRLASNISDKILFSARQEGLQLVASAAGSNAFTAATAAAAANTTTATTVAATAGGGLKFSSSKLNTMSSFMSAPLSRSTRSFHRFVSEEDATATAPTTTAAAVDSNSGDSKDTYRAITKISTLSNMKYMKIGNQGAADLAAVLDGDGIIRDICLSNARISSNGFTALALVFPRMQALRYLDLSSNAMDTAAAAALAAALPQCALLESCSVAGNRITLSGVIRLAQEVVMSSTITFFSARNNRLEPDDYQVLLKVMEEHDYVLTPEQQQRDATFPRMKHRSVEGVYSGDGYRVNFSSAAPGGGTFRLADGSNNSSCFRAGERSILGANSSQDGSSGGRSIGYRPEQPRKTIVL